AVGIVRAARGARNGTGRALHVAVRRTDDVHRRTRPPAVRGVRSVVAAHRRRRGRAVSGRSDEADAIAHAPARSHERVRHDRDLAVMDDDGYVSIVGRIKDIIIRGGENISPREVEEFLHTIHGVVEAQVIGVPCPKYGEEVMAWVRLKAGATMTGDELRAACQ